MVAPAKPSDVDGTKIVSLYLSSLFLYWGKGCKGLGGCGKVQDRVWMSLQGMYGN